ncbi:hypothetical protein M0813_28799 [Anaeramoeba flamelloides]|uniref:Uncharacterized protein n=1 Tax=Anaeramoeba flamelloides TaxID=1746091 RepID=A0ABQ8XQE8_9EUKA|nr:hypothetical protein M0813_28799 [Anaeramoeba flamelloides]
MNSKIKNLIVPKCDFKNKVRRSIYNLKKPRFVELVFLYNLLDKPKTYDQLEKTIIWEYGCMYIMGKFGVRFVNKLFTNTYDEARSRSQQLFQKNNFTEQLTLSSESEESDESTFDSQKEEENFSQEKSD